MSAVLAGRTLWFFAWMFFIGRLGFILVSISAFNKGTQQLSLFFRHFYFPQVPYSDVAGEFAISSTRLFYSLAATNLKYSSSLACSATEPTNLIIAKRVSYGSSFLNHNTGFSMTLLINELPVKFFLIQIFILPYRMCCIPTYIYKCKRKYNET